MVYNDGRDASGTRCWKTRNGEGRKLMSKIDTKVDILWDNKHESDVFLKDKNTIVHMSGATAYEFKLKSVIFSDDEK